MVNTALSSLFIIMRLNLPKPPRGNSGEANFQRRILKALQALQPQNSATIAHEYTTNGVVSNVVGGNKNGGQSTGRARWA